MQRLIYHTPFTILCSKLIERVCVEVQVARALSDEMRAALSTSTALGMFQQSALSMVVQHVGVVSNLDTPIEPAAKRAKRAPVETVKYATFAE